MSAFSSSIVALEIPSQPDKTAQSKHQKTFNQLVKKISAQREMLAAWESAAPVFQQLFVDELVPLRNAASLLEHKLIVVLDALSDHDKLTTSERQFASSLILGLVTQQGDLFSNPELKAIFNRHAGADYDEESSQQLKVMQRELEEALGEALDMNDFSSPEELMRFANQKLAEQNARAQAKQEARTERRAEKSKKPAAAVAQKEALPLSLTQSLREIYRKLASALHPDREPDPELKVRKTELLQSVNLAYDKQDILLLLETQIQLQQLNPEALADLDNERLVHYNKLLKKQLNELEREVVQAEMQFTYNYGIFSAYYRLTPDNAIATLVSEIAAQRLLNAGIEEDLLHTENIKLFKPWLKRVKRDNKEAERARKYYSADDGSGF